MLEAERRALDAYRAAQHKELGVDGGKEGKPEGGVAALVLRAAAVEREMRAAEKQVRLPTAAGGAAAAVNAVGRQLDVRAAALVQRQAQAAARRPLCFSFNGGPGACCGGVVDVAARAY